MAYIEGIQLKKQFGQNFLRSRPVVDEIVSRVKLDATTNVFEIGCGDGFLTKAILENPIKKLWVFEIDGEWAEYVRKNIPDPRMMVNESNILDIDWQVFKEDAPWVLLSNLPYHISFPILHLLVEHRQMLREGVIMVQEEVAQKIVKTHGRGYGFPSVYFQHFFEWKLMAKVPPGAFIPPPKVNSRLLYFKPRPVLDDVPDLPEFWKFIKVSFKSPRRTLRNNLQQAHYDISAVPQEILMLRAQQLDKPGLINLWKMILLKK